MARRIALGVYIACFTIGAIRHTRDFWMRSLRPDRWGLALAGIITAYDVARPKLTR